MALIEKTLVITSMDFTPGGTPGSETTSISISGSEGEDTFVYQLVDMPNAAIKAAFKHMLKEAVDERNAGAPVYDESLEVRFD